MGIINTGVKYGIDLGLTWHVILISEALKRGLDTRKHQALFYSLSIE